jgi:Tol biopolymer transport system component
MKGEPLHQVGASVPLTLKDPFYVGLGAVSHDVSITDRVEFSHVKLEPLAPLAGASPLVLYSTLQTIGTEDQYRRAIVIRTAASTLQSANWAPDGKSIHVHEDGQIVRVPLLPSGQGGSPERVDVGNLVECSGNYGLSPDGNSLAVSCAESKGGLHQVYVLAAHGPATPRKVTSGPVPSYFHAWSPDSKTIAFTRGRADKADIFTVAAVGGPEQRLTNDTVNDGPDYTPDGKYIYFDSARSGSLQIWRMKPDGTAAEQLTDDDGLNHSPHVSPDGKMIAFLSQPTAHDRIGPVCLKLMALGDGEIRTLVNFQGDRGSFSMYGWGDANHLAFVSYQMLPAEARR